MKSRAVGGLSVRLWAGFRSQCERTRSVLTSHQSPPIMHHFSQLCLFLSHICCSRLDSCSFPHQEHLFSTQTDRPTPGGSWDKELRKQEKWLYGEIQRPLIYIFCRIYMSQQQIVSAGSRWELPAAAQKGNQSIF